MKPLVLQMNNNNYYQPNVGSDKALTESHDSFEKLERPTLLDDEELGCRFGQFLTTEQLKSLTLDNGEAIRLLAREIPEVWLRQQISLGLGKCSSMDLEFYSSLRRLIWNFEEHEIMLQRCILNFINGISDLSGEFSDCLVLLNPIR